MASERPPAADTSQIARRVLVPPISPASTCIVGQPTRGTQKIKRRRAASRRDGLACERGKPNYRLQADCAISGGDNAGEASVGGGHPGSLRARLVRSISRAARDQRRTDRRPNELDRDRRAHRRQWKRGPPGGGGLAGDRLPLSQGSG